MTREFAAGLALGVFIALAGMIALLVVYGLAAPTWDGVKADTVVGGLFTMAAAGVAVIGVGWQIRTNARLEAHRRQTSLAAARLTLILDLSDAAKALETLRRLLRKDLGAHSAEETPLKDSPETWRATTAQFPSCAQALAAAAQGLSAREARIFTAVVARLQFLAAVSEAYREPDSRTYLYICATLARDLILNCLVWARGEQAALQIDDNGSKSVCLSLVEAEQITELVVMEEWHAVGSGTKPKAFAQTALDPEWTRQFNALKRELPPEAFRRKDPT